MVANPKLCGLAKIKALNGEKNLQTELRKETHPPTEQEEH